MMWSESDKHDHVQEPTYTPTKLSMLISRQSTPPVAPPPPPQTTVSVPFKWEEAPGKPRRCHTQSEPNNSDSVIKTLELPPRLLFLDAPSPTTVLAGPYVGRAMSFSSSYRTPRDYWISNFGSTRWSSFRRISREDAEGTLDFSGLTSTTSHGSSTPKPKVKKITRVPRTGSFLSLSHQPKANSHLWGSIYESFKRMVPWKRKQEKQRKWAPFSQN